MTRIHDMGGRFGDGRVKPEPEDVKFHADWHPRALALTLACGMLGQWNLDMMRRAREGLAPTDYARFAYYEKWLAALADMLVEVGLVTCAELAGEAAAEPSPLSERRVGPEVVTTILARGGPATRDSAVTARFQPGDSVRTRHLAENTTVPGGHTRLPAYAAGRTGRIVRQHGSHVLPDSNAHGNGEAPEPLYAVAFAARDLWAHPENPLDEVVLDLWQGYLSPA
ncbi:MAG: nitrile hydratase subunit beta [Pseudomonadota bacterium]